MRELQCADINTAAIAAVVTADIKADEPAIHALAAMLAVPVRVFDRDQLAAETDRLKTPSQTVFEEIGVYGVAEGAALAAAGADGCQAVGLGLGTSGYVTGTVAAASVVTSYMVLKYVLRA